MPIRAAWRPTSTTTTTTTITTTAQPTTIQPSFLLTSSLMSITQCVFQNSGYARGERMRVCVCLCVYVCVICSICAGRVGFPSRRRRTIAQRGCNMLRSTEPPPPFVHGEKEKKVGNAQSRVQLHLTIKMCGFFQMNSFLSSNRTRLLPPTPHAPPRHFLHLLPFHESVFPDLSVILTSKFQHQWLFSGGGDCREGHHTVVPISHFVAPPLLALVAPRRPIETRERRTEKKKL